MGTPKKFQFYTDSKGEYRWKIIAGNNKKVGSSGEGFASKKNVIENAKKNGHKGNGKKGWII